jgi:hypothetical protein
VGQSRNMVISCALPVGLKCGPNQPIIGSTLPLRGSRHLGRNSSLDPLTPLYRWFPFPRSSEIAVRSARPERLGSTPNRIHRNDSGFDVFGTTACAPTPWARPFKLLNTRARQPLSDFALMLHFLCHFGRKPAPVTALICGSSV